MGAVVGRRGPKGSVRLCGTKTKRIQSLLLESTPMKRLTTFPSTFSPTGKGGVFTKSFEGTLRNLGLESSLFDSTLTEVSFSSLVRFSSDFFPLHGGPRYWGM